MAGEAGWATSVPLVRDGEVSTKMQRGRRHTAQGRWSQGHCRYPVEARSGVAYVRHFSRGLPSPTAGQSALRLGASFFSGGWADYCPALHSTANDQAAIAPVSIGTIATVIRGRHDPARYRYCHKRTGRSSAADPGERGQPPYLTDQRSRTLHSSGHCGPNRPTTPSRSPSCRRRGTSLRNDHVPNPCHAFSQFHGRRQDGLNMRLVRPCRTTAALWRAG